MAIAIQMKKAEGEEENLDQNNVYSLEQLVSLPKQEVSEGMEGKRKKERII